MRTFKAKFLTKSKGEEETGETGFHLFGRLFTTRNGWVDGVVVFNG